MSNHLHLVLCVHKDKAMSWSDKQGVGRWHRLHRGTLLNQKFMHNALLRDNESMNA
jgi:putative transposase